MRRFVAWVIGALAIVSTAAYAVHLTFIEPWSECTDLQMLGGVAYDPVSPPYVDLSGPTVPNGDWYLRLRNGATSNQKIHVDTGMNTYNNIMQTFTYTARDRDASGNLVTVTKTATCWSTFQVYGWSGNDTFVMLGPCVANANQSVEFHPVLYNPLTNAPAGDDWVPPSGSVARVRIRMQDGSGQFVPHRVGTIYGEELLVADNGELDNDGPAFFEEILSLVFLDTGTYEIETIWLEAGPPDGNVKVEVNRSKSLISVEEEHKVELRPAGTVAVPAGGAPPPDEVVVSSTVVSQNDKVKMKIKIPAEVRRDLSEVVLLLERKAGSGGHEASAHGPVGAGTWEVMEGADENQPVTHPTGTIVGAIRRARTADLEVEYHACSFGGVERIRIFGVKPTFPALSGTGQKELRDKIKQVQASDPADICQLNAVEIEVKVPGLLLLPDGGSPFPFSGGMSFADYEKVGGTSEHQGPPNSGEDNNHWGTPKLNLTAFKIANEYKQVVNPIISRVRVNDMSLGDDAEGYGGKFDIDKPAPGGQWGKNKAHSHHLGHSTGRAVDIPYKVEPTIFGRGLSKKIEIQQVLYNLGIEEDTTFNPADPDASEFHSNKYFDEGDHAHVMK